MRLKGIFVSAIFLFFSAGTYANEITSIHLPEGVLAEKTAIGYVGAFPDILNEAAHRLKRPIALYAGPWVRSQKNAQRIPGAAIAPLTRIPEREDQYVWVEEILPLNLTFLIMSGTNAQYQNMDELKGKRIGVLRGSVADAMTRTLPELRKYVVLSSTGESLSKLLQHGRIDGWLIWDIVGLENMRKFNLMPFVKTTFSYTIGPLYLATNPSVSIKEVQLWQHALREMKQDGTIATIIRQHYGNKIVAALKTTPPYSPGTPTEVEYSK